jgi:membrane protein DedA with SNARE-associated domain
MHIFEGLMLLCFGAAWPLSVYKSFRSRTTKGKSLWFLIVIFIGYISGIIHKVYYHPDIIIILYILNGSLVLTDIVLYFRNKRIEKNTEEITDY